jgi:hypothetical protein
VEAARALMEEAGMMDFVHEMTSLDSGITRDTADATAAQLRDAGFKVERIIIPSSTFWNDWDTYPFSVTFWGHRALAVQTFLGRLSLGRGLERDRRSERRTRHRHRRGAHDRRPGRAARGHVPRAADHAGGGDHDPTLLAVSLQRAEGEPDGR